MLYNFLMAADWLGTITPFIAAVGGIAVGFFSKRSDGESQLRKDLLEERKTLLTQILAERQFYSSEILSLKTEIDGLRKRIDSLEGDVTAKDQLILAQQGEIQELRQRTHAQEQLIEVLQNENVNLKAKDSK